MRILIVEDEKDISEALAHRLRFNKFKVDIADNGEDGLFLARTNKYCLMILDYDLPKYNGYQICEAIRQEKINLPIIMLTIKSELENKIDMLDLGVDDYVIKPFFIEEFMARIRAVLRRPKIIEKEKIIIDDLMIDKSNFIVMRGKKKIYLTRKEFMLLLYLAKNKNCVISSDEILENVWDMNADLFTQTVKTHIMNIRRKIDNGFETKLIHTIPCRGYILGSKKL